MKPIFLSFQAFGPYLEKTQVEFEKLNQAALFLICGPTGGGKTSILDAMCFALYCRATGGKRDFKSMRCSSAAQDSPTEVTFQFALGDKAYKFFRSLYYHTNRRTKQPEPREIHECHCLAPDGSWELLESGAEAGVRKKAEELLHLTCEQFSQVIVLPQGDFLRLLRANSKEKGDMLKTLFGAEIWQKVTDIAAVRLKRLDGESRELQARRSALLEQAQAANMQELKGLLEQAGTSLSAYEKAGAELAADTAAAAEVLELAQTYMRLKTVAQETNQAWKAAVQQADAAEKNKAALNTAKEDVSALQIRANLAGKEAAALRQSEQILEKALFSLAQAEEKEKLAQAAETRLTQQAGQITDLEKRTVQGKNFITDMERASAGLAQLLTRQAGLEAALAAYQELVVRQQKQAQLLQRQKELALCREQQQKRWEELSVQLDRQTAIRQGNAAFALAQELQEGTPCPVCGAVHHPLPAAGTGDALPAREFQNLQAAVQEAQKELQKYLLELERTGKELEEMQRQIQQQEAHCKSLSTLPAAELLQAAEAGKTGIAAAQQAAGKLQRARERVELLVKEREALLAAQTVQKEQAAAYRAQAETLKISAAETRAALPNLELSQLQQKQKLLLLEEQQLNLNAQALSGKYEQAITVESRAKAALAAANAEHIKARTAFAALETPWTAESLPDLFKLQARHKTLQHSGLENSALLGNAQNRLATLKATWQTAAQLEQGLQGIQDSYEAAARLTRSLSGSNAYKMPILQYVLSMMLEEILASANQFFGTLSRGRYALRRVTEQKTGNALRGLDLEVLDGFSMTPRSIETLSGGEQFLASLSLAFGLSDAVQNHSGAVQLDALFIDEGFGTLDGETLDVAMKALNTLHEGGRAVGIISHVAELRTRIHSRIEIHRDSGGHASLKTITED